jgi:hypothetical protein
MRRLNNILAIVSILAVYFLSACKKETKIYTPVPFLTGRIWIADTITINPPMTFSQLNSADQQSYRAAIGWFKIAKLTLNDDGTVTQSGDYDFGYKTWRLVNNNSDIEMTLYGGTKQILQNWVADAIHFSYTYAMKLNTTFDCIFIFK